MTHWSAASSKSARVCISTALFPKPSSVSAKHPVGCRRSMPARRASWCSFVPSFRTVPTRPPGSRSERHQNVIIHQYGFIRDTAVTHIGMMVYYSCRTSSGKKAAQHSCPSETVGRGQTLLPGPALQRAAGRWGLTSKEVEVHRHLGRFTAINHISADIPAAACSPTCVRTGCFMQRRRQMRAR
jgi:hypothetical protein